MAVQRIQELIGLMQKNLECSICLELMKSPVATQCEHYFCRFCLTEFLEKKRSVPCPLCKQPITKRSLKDKGELNNIVSAVSNLISAFQDDTGVTYSPSTGPQTFFPSTPDTIDNKPGSHQAKAKKNVRRSRGSSKQQVEEASSNTTEADSSLLSDDGFAAPQVPKTSKRNSTRRSKSATRISSPTSSVIPETGPSTSTLTHGRTRSRSKTRTAAATDSDSNNELLQCLDENSCGLQKEIQQPALSAEKTSDTPGQEKNDQQTKSSYLEAKDGEAMETAADTDVEECNVTRTVEMVQGERKEVLHTAEVQVHEPEATTSDIDPDLTADNTPDNTEERSHDKEEQLERNQEQKLSKRVARKNAKNLENRPETDKENLIEPKKHISSKRTNDEPKAPPLACSSQNSSDDGSISSTQQFQRPLPVVTKTYSRRSAGRNVSEKVEKWMACLPSGQNTNNQQKPESDPVVDQSTADYGKNKTSEKEEESASNIEDIDVTVKSKLPTENDENRKGISREVSSQEEEESLTAGVPEQLEEFMPTPPIRKKRIFKRKNVKKDEESDSPTIPTEEHTPPADPYAFVVGHTPVAKSKKKRGRPRSKQKIGQPQFANPLSLNTSDKKSVRFSEASSETMPNTTLFSADREKDQTQADESAFTGETDGLKRLHDMPPTDADCVIVRTEKAEGSPSPFVKPHTRSRLKTRSKACTNQESQSGGNKGITEQRSTRRKRKNKGESPEAEKLREEQTQQLASWIGQAEDHDFLFSTQEARASIDSMHSADKESFSRQNDLMNDRNDNEDDGEVIALMEEDENSNDGVLIGPVEVEKPSSIQSCQQEADFDRIAQEHSHSDPKASDSNANPTEIELSKRNDNSKKSVSPVPSQNKCLANPEPNQHECSPGPRKKVDTVPETQLSTLESPSSSSIVLPSPAVAMALPRFITPKIPSVKQSRSSKNGQGENVDNDHGSGQKDTGLADVSFKPDSRKPDEPATSVDCSASVPGAEGGDSSQSLMMPSQSGTSLDAVQAMSKPISPPSAAAVVKRSPNQKQEKAKALTASPSPKETRQSLPSRLRRQKKGFSNSSPPVTVIPSTITEDSSSDITSISSSAKEQQENPTKDAAEALKVDVQQLLSSEREVEEGGKESEAAGSLFTDTDKSGRSHPGRHQSPDTQEDLPFAQEPGDADPDVESDSSSTEDLDIDPADHEFEEPDLTLQSEEIHERYLTRQKKQDGSMQEDNWLQSLSDDADTPTDVKRSLPSHPKKLPPEHPRSEKECSKQVRKKTEAGLSAGDLECQEQGKKKNKQNTEFDVDSESSTQQCPQRLPSLTQIPETLEIEESSSKTKTPLSDSLTHGVDEGNGYIDSQRSGKTNHTRSSTIDQASSQSEAFSPAQSQQLLHGPCKEGSKHDTAGVNSDNQTSSTSATPSPSILQPAKADTQTSTPATPSQSILQPVRGEIRSTNGQTEVCAHQPESATASHSQQAPSQEVIGSKHPESPKHAQESERKLDGLREHGDKFLVDDQTLNGSDSSPQPEASESTSPLAGYQKMSRHSEGKTNSDEDQVPLKGVKTMPKLLAQGTQNLQNTDDQSLSLLSQQVVLDSLADDKGPSEASDGKESTRTIAQSVESQPEETYPSLSLKSPASLKTKKKNQKKDSVDSSPSLVSPANRKRKLDEVNDNGKVTCPLSSAELFPEKSPSSVSSKVISSAPPRTTSLATGSEDDDDVRIVRRTKRKCFSLEGSPAQKRTPLSIKRRRCRGKQRDLSEAFDKEADSGAQQSFQNFSLMSEGSKEDKIAEKDQEIVSADDQKVNRSNLEESNNDVEGTNIEDITSSSSEQLLQTAAAEDVKTTTTPKTSPVYPRRKTARGLARHRESPDCFADAVHGHTTPGAPGNAEKSEPGVQTGLGKLGADSSVRDTGKRQLTSKRQMLVQISDDDEPIEVDGDASVDSGRKNLLKLNNQNQAQACHSHVDTEGGRLIQKDPLEIPQGSAGTVDRPIVVTESSDKCPEQKSQTVAVSSISASLEDATIPPPSFDLRFDEDEEEEEEDENTNCRSIEDQSLQKTERTVNSEHADSFGRRRLVSKSEQNKEECCTTVDNKTEGRAEADPIEKVGKEEVKTTAGGEEEVQSSGGSEKRVLSSEEEPVVVMKKKRTAVIDSDSEDSDQGSDGGSEASLQLNFTSSSAVSSQSEILTTQDRSKMEGELDRLRREICEMEAKLQAQNSTRSDSNGDRNPASVRSETASGMAASDDSSDEEVEKFSGNRRKKRGKSFKSSNRDTSFSRSKRPRRRQVISSDEDDEESKEPRQQLMDSYLSNVKEDAEDHVGTGTAAEKAKGASSPLSQTPEGKAKKRASPVTSDEDSSDLFLSPLSPSPPPPIKHSLARADPHRWPQPPFSLDSPSLAGSRSGTKLRQSLDFARGATEWKMSVDERKELDNVQQDSQESTSGLSGQVRRIPESQFTASGGVDNAQKSDVEGSQQESENVLQQNLTSANVHAVDVDSSGSLLPSLPSELMRRDDDEEKDKENITEEMEDEVDDNELPRWRRKKFGFISSGLDQEKLSCLRKLAEAHECKVYSKFNDYVTHVIIRAEKDSQVCERTLKYFQGIASQCWVLTYDWVLQSLSHVRFAPEKQFEIQGDTVKGDNHGGPQLSRMSSLRLLEGFAFASVGVSSDMSKKELTQLLMESGAEVVDDPWALASHQADHKLVLRCVDSEAKPPTPAEIELFDGQYKHFGLVTIAREWILDSVCTHHLQPLKEYVFNTCPNLKLPV